MTRAPLAKPQTPETFTPAEIRNRLDAGRRVSRVEIDLTPQALESAVCFMLERAGADVKLKNGVLVACDNWAWNHGGGWVKAFAADGSRVTDGIFSDDDPSHDDVLSYVIQSGVVEAKANTSSGRDFSLIANRFCADFGEYGSNNFVYDLLSIIEQSGDVGEVEWAEEDDSADAVSFTARASIKRNLGKGKPSQQDIRVVADIEHGESAE